VRDSAETLAALAADAKGLADELSQALDRAAALPPEGKRDADRIPPARANGGPPRSPAPVRDADGIPGRRDQMNESTRRMVEELSRFAPLWLDRGQLALLLGRGKRSSTLTMQLAEAVDAGALENDRGRYRVPLDGKQPSPAEMREAFRAALPDGPRALFDVLADKLHGDGFARADLFGLAGFSPTSSTPVTHLKLLTDNGLAEKLPGGYVALGPAVR
jgi:hypothetical protein